MTWLIFAISAGVGVLVGIGYLIGWQTGRQHGRDEQWADDFIQHGRKEAARRDAQGRFRSTEGTN